VHGEELGLIIVYCFITPAKQAMCVRMRTAHLQCTQRVCAGPKTCTQPNCCILLAPEVITSGGKPCLCIHCCSFWPVVTASVCFLNAAGTDVARKMIILGRECGLAVEMQQVHVQSLVPPQLADTQSADDFMARLPQVRQYFTH